MRKVEARAIRVAVAIEHADETCLIGFAFLERDVKSDLLSGRDAVAIGIAYDLEHEAVLRVLG
jgi:hypothetical protein